MDPNHFCSLNLGSDCFPTGLRVLVVDNDASWLNTLENMLQHCNYEVTTCNLTGEALNLLQEGKNGFDIVIIDVNMPDIDALKLLQHGLNIDLPVIMMSVDGETSWVMKGVHHGACDYLLKPIRIEELQKIWQHVYRKRIQKVKDIDGQESLTDETMKNEMKQLDNGYSSGDMISVKKRKDADNRECGESSSAKKARVVWTVDLHQNFVKAVNQIGLDKVGPKKILDLMGVPWLTRENVASHLQKYRLYLSRLQKENELKAASNRIRLSDVPTMNHASISQTSVTVQQNILTIQPMPQETRKAALLEDVTNNLPISSRITFNNHFYGPLDSELKPQRANIPPLQFRQELEHRFDHLQLSQEVVVDGPRQIYDSVDFGGYEYLIDPSLEYLVNDQGLSSS